MSVLIDTGILLRLFVPADPVCQAIRDAVMHLRRHDRVATTFQNIAEFWHVSTRPPTARGGYGLSPIVVEARVRFIERSF